MEMHVKNTRQHTRVAPTDDYFLRTSPARLVAANELVLTEWVWDTEYYHVLTHYPSKRFTFGETAFDSSFLIQHLQWNTIIPYILRIMVHRIGFRLLCY